MTALRGVATVDTRYGGRFVQSIDGISGSLTREQRLDVLRERARGARRRDRRDAARRRSRVVGLPALGRPADDPRRRRIVPRAVRPRHRPPAGTGRGARQRRVAGRAAPGRRAHGPRGVDWRVLVGSDASLRGRSGLPQRDRLAARRRASRSACATGRSSGTSATACSRRFRPRARRSSRSARTEAPRCTSPESTLRRRARPRPRSRRTRRSRSTATRSRSTRTGHVVGQVRRVRPGALLVLAAGADRRRALDPAARRAGRRSRSAPRCSCCARRARASRPLVGRDRHRASRSRSSTRSSPSRATPSSSPGRTCPAGCSISR